LFNPLLWSCHFSYGANMSFDTLARRGVKVLQRAPCVLFDPNLKLVFQHRAGAQLHESAEEARNKLL
jgi:hypothetical protein